MRIFGLVLIVPLAVLVILFAFSNRDPVSLGLWPLSRRIDMEAYLIVVIPFLAGLLIGAVLAFLSAAGNRRQARRLRRETRSLDGIVAANRAQENQRAMQAKRTQAVAQRDRLAADSALIAEQESLLDPGPRALPKAFSG